MTEREIYKKAVEYLERNYPEAILWKSPAFRNMRWDIFGVFDLIVLNQGRISFVQFTTLTNLSHRRNKIKYFLSSTRWHNNYNVIIMAWDSKKDEFKIEKINYNED